MGDTWDQDLELSKLEQRCSVLVRTADMKAELERLRAENERLRKNYRALRHRLTSAFHDADNSSDGYEMRRARAESRVNEFEDAIDAAMNRDGVGCECLRASC